MDEIGGHRTSRDYPRYRVLATVGAIAVSIVGTISGAVAVAQQNGHGMTRPEGTSPAAGGTRAAMAAVPPPGRLADDRADRSVPDRAGHYAPDRAGRYAPDRTGLFGPDRADRSARARLSRPVALPRLERRMTESVRGAADQGAMSRTGRTVEGMTERRAGRGFAAEHKVEQKAEHKAEHKAGRGARAKAERERRAERRAERKAERKAARAKAEREEKRKAKRGEKRKAKRKAHRKGKRRAVLATGRCLASFYASGQTTASGQPFRPERLTAAHKSLPFGSRVRVIRPDTGKSVTVRINDRGPYIDGRCLDLSRGAMRKMGGISAGVMPVRYEVMSRG